MRSESIVEQGVRFVRPSQQRPRPLVAGLLAGVAFALIHAALQCASTITTSARNTLLLGLLREGEGVAARVLCGLGMYLNAARGSVELIISWGQPGVVGDIGLTPRAKKVIELTVEEARQLDQHYVGTEHILLGLVREGGGIAVAILESHGVATRGPRQLPDQGR
jgi:ATP-dependent Clp protease ATP-binding subunit ClpA